VINWGCSTLPNFDPAQIINNPEAVRVSSNKLSFFEACRVDPDQRPIVCPWTTNRQQAVEWVEDGHKVVCRTLLTSHSGNGIIIAESENELVRAPLYTRYVKKQAEYRVHIVRGNVIDVQRKIRDPEREPTDWNVRSHANGFVYVRQGFELPADAQAQALRAFRASGLDFGAVDVVFNARSGLATVLEINTAPGLTGTTVENYARAFRENFF
jgi:glutathione synthase/RimK-type ligase-like ATP-grasp enzyme